MRTPAGSASYREQFEQLKARMDLADPDVQKVIDMAQRVIDKCTKAQRGGEKAGEMVEREPSEDMTGLDMDLLAEIDSMGGSKPEKGQKG
mmetsp:Transcript_22140/g.49241  ORF Transcript_22140/g.49241 Transcript_22140/m.49241 type:complete len:90 (+) Transcript_22140:245-514(+)